MPRIQIPEIPDDFTNKLLTLESALSWKKTLEVAKKKLEEELYTVRAALEYVVNPKINTLYRETFIKEHNDGGK